MEKNVQLLVLVSCINREPDTFEDKFQSKEHYVFLFTDLLVITNRKNKKEGQFVRKTQILLPKAKLVWVDDGSKYEQINPSNHLENKNAFQLNLENVTYNFIPLGTLTSVTFFFSELHRSKSRIY